MTPRFLAVPVDKLCRQWSKARGPEDMPEELLARFAHFFEHYKDLEEGKWVRVVGWEGAEAAKKEILDSIAMYNEAPKKPPF